LGGEGRHSSAAAAILSKDAQDSVAHMTPVQRQTLRAALAHHEQGDCAEF
jgi:hypothetical protein